MLNILKSISFWCGVRCARRFFFFIWVFISDCIFLHILQPFFSGCYYCCRYVERARCKRILRNEINLNGPISPWRELGNSRRKIERKKKEEPRWMLYKTQRRTILLCELCLFRAESKKKKNFWKSHFRLLCKHILECECLATEFFIELIFSRKRRTRATLLCEFCVAVEANVIRLHVLRMLYGVQTTQRNLARHRQVKCTKPTCTFLVPSIRCLSMCAVRCVQNWENEKKKKKRN